MEKGDYTGAGCVHHCRPFRWNRFYGRQGVVPEIPEGFGRMPEHKIESGNTVLPKVITIEIDGKCNLKCAHCLGTGVSKGIAKEKYTEILPLIEKARYLRFIGGEFTVNPEFIKSIQPVKSMQTQPTLFMVTNGQCDMGRINEGIASLKSFHLKFSLEGLNAEFEKVRGAGSWERFERNLTQTIEAFAGHRKEGKDRKIFLNFCTMKSNFKSLPDIIKFADEKKLPLVVNTLNGMRHTGENMFSYEYLKPGDPEIQEVLDKSMLIMKETGYKYKNDVMVHLDYIVKAIQEKKPRIPGIIIRTVKKKFSGINADRLLYLVFLLLADLRGFYIHITGKTKKKIFSYFNSR
ncbi:MAG TPA: hypothetical protein PLB12_11255 [Candidatus Goldiibacteriota bacterium]|nr:hypothetical protein [Candidatus Goldiibacteriota bacterium]